MVRACDAKRGTLRWKEGEGNQSTGEKEERKNYEKMVGKSKDDIKEKGLSADAVYDRATWRRICHRTSTPHESGNKTKRKLKKKNDIHLLVIDHNQCHMKYEEIRYCHVTYV